MNDAILERVWWTGFLEGNRWPIKPIPQASSAPLTKMRAKCGFGRHPTPAYINSTSYLYLLHFILFQISNQITMNKNRLFSPHNRHSYPSSMKEVCHHRLSSPTCHESPTTQWKGIWSTYRTVAGPTPNFSTPSSLSWVYLCHSLKDIIFHSLFSWKCCLFGWKVWESFRNNLYGTTLHVPSFWYLAMIENKYTVIAYFCLIV